MDLSQIFKNFTGADGGDIFSLLEKIQEDDLIPVALLLGVDKKTLAVIIKLIPKFVKGEISLQSILPHLIPVAISYFLLPEKETAEDEDDSENNGELKETTEDGFQLFDGFEEVEKKNSATEKISSVADDDIFYSINSYMQKN